MLRVFQKNKQKIQFDEWVTQYHRILYKHAFWMVGNQDTAMEMVQDAYFQAWISRKNLHDQGKALPWLLTILRRVIYRYQRDQYRNTETVAQLQLLDGNETQTDAYQLLELYALLEKMSENQREVFLLHNLHGFSYEEISQQLQIPMGTVMSRLARAREFLKKQHAEDTANVIFLDKEKRGLDSET